MTVQMTNEQAERLIERQNLTLSDLATIYGCCGLFDLCADQDVLSLSLQGADPFLDWLGWQASDVCIIHKEFIAWMRPEQDGGDCTDGWLPDVCHDPNTIEWGKCDWQINDFGTIGRQGPARDIAKTDLRYCERQPRYRIDGTLVDDDMEYDLIVTAEVLLQDLRRGIVNGNAANAAQFDGLQRLVRTGYTNTTGGACQMMDANVVNWNSNPMAGGAGITWNGTAQPAGFDFVDYLLAVYRRIRQRIGWSPQLAAQQLKVGDIVLAMPSMFLQCLMDFYTCWSVCTGGTDNPVTIDSYEARQFRTQLLGGMFGQGRIFLDGFEIPLIGYDWGLINGPTTGDIYMLTGQIGNVKVLHGQYNDMRNGAAGRDEYFYTDGGRFLGKRDNDNRCELRKLWMDPRLICWAPWAQARFQDVICTQPGGQLSPDPCETSFFPQTSFSVAACP